MAGLVRKTAKQFGASGPSTAFGQFGSKVAGATQTTQDPAVIQALAAWSQGWQNAIVASDKAAYLQDMNGFCFVDSYQLTYLFQMGIPEWDSATLYFTNSIVQTQSNGQWFRSLQGGAPGVGAGQSGNAPPASASNAFWAWINNPAVIGDGGVTVGKIPKTSAAAPGVLVDSLLSETGGNVKIASGGFQFADNTVQTTAAVSSNAVTVQSPPAAYADNPARVIGATYQNLGTKPRFVAVYAYINGTGWYVYCDGSPAPTTQVGGGSGSAGNNIGSTSTFVVLPGYYYKIVGGTLLTWTEWT